MYNFQRITKSTKVIQDWGKLTSIKFNKLHYLGTINFKHKNVVIRWACWQVFWFSQVKEKIFAIVSSAYKELLQVPLTCSELWHSSNTMDPFTVSSYGELIEFARTTNGRSFLQGKHLTKDNMVDFYYLHITDTLRRGWLWDG